MERSDELSGAARISSTKPILKTLCVVTVKFSIHLSDYLRGFMRMLR